MSPNSQGSIGDLIDSIRCLLLGLVSSGVVLSSARNEWGRRRKEQEQELKKKRQWDEKNSGGLQSVGRVEDG
jgi:hypothetical protein